MKFSDSIGLHNLGAKMAQNVLDKRIAHAQMFVGADGSEILSMARAYITFIFCENKQGKDSCGTCSSCVKMEKLVHPDVHWIFPAISVKDTSGKQGQDEAIGKFQKVWRDALLKHPFLSYPQWQEALGEEKKSLMIHGYAAQYLFAKMSLKSYEGGMKVAVIWKPELLNIKAANTLLKIIEEPPAKTLFLLLSENPDDVLTTICSRTQITRLPKSQVSDLGNWLKEKIGLNEQAAETIAFAADGNIGSALLMAKELGGENELFVIFRAWMRLCFSRDLEALRQWISEQSKLSRDMLSGLLKYGLQIILGALQVSVSNKEPNLINPGEREFIKKFAPFVNAGNASGYYTLFNDAIADIQWNGNAKIILSDLSFKFMMLLHQKKG